MQTAHILRKYNPNEWGGIESYLYQIIPSLTEIGVSSHLFAPKLKENLQNPIKCPLSCYRSCLPIIGMDAEKKRQLIKIGGNIVSLDLLYKLLQKEKLALIHSHCLGRIGAIARYAAKKRGVPFLVSIHGAALDLPPDEKRRFQTQGFDFGKGIGWFFRARHLLKDADAVICFNKREEQKLKSTYPKQRIVRAHHAIDLALFETRYDIYEKHSYLKGRDILLSLARIDPQKNQLWLVQQIESLRADFPSLHLVLLGAVTDNEYENAIRAFIRNQHLKSHVTIIPQLPPNAPELIGFLQNAKALVLPSLSEPFGIVILEALAAKTPILSSDASGPCELITDGETGYLFPINDKGVFRAKIHSLMKDSSLNSILIEKGFELVKNHYQSKVIAKELKSLYRELIEEKRRCG